VGYLPDDFFEHEFVERMSSKGFNFCLFYIREMRGVGCGFIYGTWFALRAFATAGKNSSNCAAMHIVSGSVQVLACQDNGLRISEH